MDKRTARRRAAAQQGALAPATAVDATALGDSPGGDMQDREATKMSGFRSHVDPLDQVDENAAAIDAEDARQSRLDTFAGALVKRRKAAVDHRRMSGIEDIWREDEEFYEGIDEANRNESVTIKPRDNAGTGGASISDDESGGTGSTVFLNIARPYCDFSSGRAADMLLPTDDGNWDLRETPMPDVIKAFGDATPLNVPGSPHTTIGDAAKAMVADARKKVMKAKTRIDDWHEEGQFNAEQRKILKDAAKVGVGVLKGPFPVKSIARAITRDEKTGAITLAIQNKTSPVSKRISYWDFYPSAGCGEDIHKGDGTWEKDRITGRQLRDLMGTMDADGNPMYLEDAIKKCLKEGPSATRADDESYNAADNETFLIWYYNGVASPDDLAAAGVEVDADEVIPVTITMVNDRVIKAAQSSLESGTFPYDVMVWQPREGHWAGIGVARQVRAPQRMINAGVRNMLDNAGLAAGPQIVVVKGAVQPMGKGVKFGIRPRQMWTVDPEKMPGNMDVTKAFAAIEIPMITTELMVIVQFALKMAEDVTGLPMLMQGQQGQATDTVGGMQILTNNSNTPLRMIAKQYDDRIGVPHNLRYYEWLLMYGPEDDEKGEFIVAARGSSALFERDAQNQAILQMGQLVQDPKYKINPEKWFAQFLKAQRLTASDFQYTDAEWAQIQEEQKNAPPPVDPKVQTAQIGAKARVDAATITAEVQKERIARDADRDAEFARAEAERTNNDHTAKMEELALRERLAILDYANTKQMTIENVKAKLADTAMRLQTQRELSSMTAGLDLHKHHNPAPATEQALPPPTEPAGRAADGQSWEQ